MTIHSEHLELDKWVHAVSDQSSLHQAVCYSLRNRLASLQQHFPTAAMATNANIEDVHQLRVATRRALAALDLYAELLPTKPTRRLRRLLRKIQCVSGNVRDLDVLARRYQKVEHKNARKLVVALGRRRSRMQFRLAKLYLRLSRRGRLLKQAEKLLAKFEKADDSSELALIWMKMRWRQLAKVFFESADVNTNDLDTLHRFRISGKRLRYSMELLAPAFDPEHRERAYDFVERLQERLGRLQDHVVAHKLFCNWKSKRNRTSSSCDLDQLIVGEIKMLQKARDSFDAWWTPAMKSDMRQAIDQINL